MRFVIVGGGVAGITAALDLARRAGHTIEVYTDEEHSYYYRPQLTEFLAGAVTLETLLRRPLEWYAERGIQIHLGQPVVALHPLEKAISLRDGTRVAYDKLLLAMGSLPFIPPIPGIEKAGVQTWRTLADTLRLEQTAQMCRQTVVLGGGLLGLEAARGLRGFCSQVTVLEFFPRLLPRQLDVPAAGLLQRFVESLGITVMVGAQTEAILGDDHVTGVRLKDGREVPAQAIMVAAGVRSNAQLAQSAGVAVDRGVVVDERMATNLPDIYAAGDVAVFKGYSWAIAPIAQAQARVAAANMVGETAIYDPVVPSTTLKVVGIEVASVGIVNPEEPEYEQTAHLNDAAGTYKKIVLRDGVIVGTIVINDKNLARKLEAMIAQRVPLTLAEAETLVRA